MFELQQEFKTNIIIMTPTTQAEPLREEIEQFAYHLYEQRGCQPGHELEDWLEAEKQLISAAGEAGATKQTSEEEQSNSRASDQQRRRKAQRLDDY